jgi:hypothetical protein
MSDQYRIMNPEEVPVMPAIEVPDLLPPAITLPREVIELAINQDLAEFGEHSLVAHTWHWILHGGAPGPISHMDWSEFDGDGPPPKATLAAESTADQPPLLACASWAELNKARFICWWCTANPEEEVPRRFHAWDTAPNLDVPEEGPAAIIMPRSAQRLTHRAMRSSPRRPAGR